MKKTHRKLAREKAVFAIYQWLLLNASLEELELFLASNPTLVKDEEARLYAQQIIQIVIGNFAGYRLEICRYLKKGWTFERLSYLEQAILLCALAELKDLSIDKKIAVNEAVELAKQYCDEGSYRFINGILKNIE